MQVKMIKDKNTKYGPIQRGEILTVRKLPDGTLFSINSPYQVIEGHYAGEEIPLTHCILLDEKKTSTEKEWLAKVEEERKQKELAQALVKELTDAIKKKDSLLAFSQVGIKAAILRIQELEKEKA